MLYVLPKIEVSVSTSSIKSVLESDFKPITYETKPDSELIIKSVLEHFTYLQLEIALEDMIIIDKLSKCHLLLATEIIEMSVLQYPMWEIHLDTPPFTNHEHDYNFAINIIDGIRPEIVSGTPLEYKNLMKKYWDA
ncbi:hypothetical protein RhiirA4_482529 [Rhizophagus irregularis]|uniref:Uncharacterized protein n=1 Tax=Rhizophagus irregularis TaxID=588596 RepID=A0A2I1HL79_9GLOM|nr:hypothetical protein RhiirA4_482529 [Rhizophagus irregularis]